MMKRIFTRVFLFVVVFAALQSLASAGQTDNQICIQKASSLRAEFQSGASELENQPFLTFEQLQKTGFSGTEPFWGIRFHKDYMLFTPYPGAPEELFRYTNTPAGQSPIKVLSHDEIQIQVHSTTEGREQNWRIIIRNQPCGDGMSDNTYAYTIDIVKRSGSSAQGCIQGCGGGKKASVTIQEIRATRKIKRFEVSEVMYKPNDEFHVAIKENFRFHGRFSIDPMSDQLTFSVDEASRPDIEVVIDGFTRPLVTSFYFANEQEVAGTLGGETMAKIMRGEKVEETILVKSYSFGGKIDGYGGASATFIKLMDARR
ncbi:MAG: hypothetical protein R6U85_11245 [Salinivirgaceae bacterium]